MNFKSLSKIKDEYQQVHDILNSLLAEEFLAWYNYYIFTQFLVGKERPAIQKVFSKFADDELHDHASRLMERLNQLRMKPSICDPTFWNSVSKCHIQEAADYTTNTQLEVNIGAEECAINHYMEAIGYFSEIGDITTTELLKSILADEEQHLAELKDFHADIYV